MTKPAPALLFRYLLLGRPASAAQLRALAARLGLDAIAFSDQVRYEATLGLIRFDSPSMTWRAV